MYKAAERELVEHIRLAGRQPDPCTIDHGVEVMRRRRAQPAWSAQQRPPSDVAPRGQVRGQSLERCGGERMRVRTGAVPG
jgi:hypothetical protein